MLYHYYWQQLLLHWECYFVSIPVIWKVPCCLQLLFLGVVAIIVALFLLFAKLKKDIYVKTGSPVSKKNIFYDTADFFGIKNALENGDFQAIKRIKTIEDGNVQIYALYSKDRKFAAVQLLKYEPFDFIPQTNIIIMENDKAEDLINAIA